VDQEAASMKYYVYVSRTKVDMLVSQIPPKISQRIAAELDIDLKLIQVKLTSTHPGGRLSIRN
jgi:hypothetical protein